MIARLIETLRATDRPEQGFEAVWRVTVKRRALVILGFLVFWGVVIEGRLVALQVFQHETYMERATRQQHSVVKISARRGDITDRNGQILAASVDAAQVFADPSQITDGAAVAKALCGAFRDCTGREQSDLAARLSNPDSEFALVRRARAVTPDQIQRVQKLKIRGIGFLGSSARYYPNVELAAHVVGFVGSENQGLGGIEGAYDDQIRGQEGRVLVQVDAHRNGMQAWEEQAPTPGATVELTIDATLQHIAERELKAGIEANHAHQGTAIVMNPMTGEILALANYPTYDPNLYNRASDDERRNRAVQDVYEPGSTFKIVTASAAIQEGVLTPTDIIDTSPGYITFPGRKPIRDTHAHGAISFEDVVVLSSNVGAIKAGLRVGAERMARYVRRFGFGTTISDDFRGESAGLVWNPASLNDSEFASMSMGYHISVTPLQMATAASAIANGGALIEPHVVRAFIRDGRREDVAPKVLRQAVTADTAATLTQMLEGVVARGTATTAQIDRYPVAGKTGTAAKVIDGHYSTSEYNASFVGFVPSRRPAFTILVVIDSPKAGDYYGGLVAAPIFKRIAEAALQQYGVPPSVNPAATVVVSAEHPTAAPVQTRTTILPAMTMTGGRAVMPDVRGLSMRDALRVLGRAGLTVRLAGDGVVVSQTPEAGQPIDVGGSSALQLRRTGPDPAPGGKPR